LPQIVHLDPARDRMLLIAAPGLAAHVWSHEALIALLLSAMRHFAADLRQRGITVDFVALDDPDYAALRDLVDRLGCEDRAAVGARVHVMLQDLDQF
jgi:deoxyribodipyrimidine photolyase-like uncharacterized protein